MCVCVCVNSSLSRLGEENELDNRVCSFVTSSTASVRLVCVLQIMAVMFRAPYLMKGEQEEDRDEERGEEREREREKKK